MAKKKSWWTEKGTYRRLETKKPKPRKPLKPKGAKYVFFNRSVGKKKEWVFLDGSGRIVARRISTNKPHPNIKKISPVVAYAIKHRRR